MVAEGEELILFFADFFSFAGPNNIYDWEKFMNSILLYSVLPYSLIAAGNLIVGIVFCIFWTKKGRKGKHSCPYHVVFVSTEDTYETKRDWMINYYQPSKSGMWIWM